MTWQTVVSLIGLFVMALALRVECRSRVTLFAWLVGCALFGLGIGLGAASWLPK